MKQNSSFLLKEIAGVPYLLPYGQMIADHKRGLKTNSTGAYLWNLLKEERSMDEILSLSAAHFEISNEDMAEFNEDITSFINQLRANEILTDNDKVVSYSDTVKNQWNISRKNASLNEMAPDNTNNVCEQLFSIGNLIIKYSGPSEAFPEEFKDFLVSSSPENAMQIQQTVFLHPYLPPMEPFGQVLLYNQELNIMEQEEQYLLLFPSAKNHLELHLSKDGSEAHFYSLPPYTQKFLYDFFHAIRLAYLYLAQKHSMAALHSASILYQDKLWLFSGHSGIGKSTHTNLWKEYFDTPVINGDLNLLATLNGTPVVHGLPWCGTSGIHDAKTYPLGGIILINRGKTNYTEELSTDQKQLLISQRLISPSWTEDQWNKNLDIVERITENILVCKLYCTKDKEAAEVIKRQIDTQLSHI